MSKSTELGAQLLHISHAEGRTDRQLLALRRIPILRVVRRLDYPVKKLGKGEYIIPPKRENTNLIIDTKTNTFYFKRKGEPKSDRRMSSVEFYMLMTKTPIKKTMRILREAFPKYSL